MHEAYLPVEDTIKWDGLSKNWSIFWRFSSESTIIIPLAYGIDGLGKMYAYETEVCSCIKSLNDDGNKFLSKFSISIKRELGHCPPRSLSSSQSVLYLLFVAAVHKEEVKKSWKCCIITSDGDTEQTSCCHIDNTLGTIHSLWKQRSRYILGPCILSPIYEHYKVKTCLIEWNNRQITASIFTRWSFRYRNLILRGRSQHARRFSKISVHQFQDGSLF